MAATSALGIEYSTSVLMTTSPPLSDSEATAAYAARAAAWLHARTKQPAFLMVKLDEPLRSGDTAFVQAFPGMRWPEISDFVAKRGKGIKLRGFPFVVFGGRLTSETAPHLETVLTLISRIHGLDLDESMAFLAQVALWNVEVGVLMDGSRSPLDPLDLSIFDTSTSEKTQAVKDEMNRARLSIEDILDFWDRVGGRLAINEFMKSPDGSAGRPSYYSFPPGWMRADQMHLLGDDSKISRKVPVLVDISIAEMTRRSAEFFQGLNKNPSALTVNFTPASNAIDDRKARQSTARLNAEEEAEFRKHRFQCRQPIFLTGITQGRSQNVVEVSGQDVLLPDSSFRFFVRLVVALFDVPNGYVDRGTMMTSGGLASEGLYSRAAIDQATSRLRIPFHTVLAPLSPKKLVEVTRGQVRLSTHRAFITWDGERLGAHEDATIRKLIGRLNEHRPNGAKFG